jgi:hypothetical protein
VAVTDRWYRSDAESAERIPAVILSVDIIGDDSTEDRAECNRDYMEPRKVTPTVQKTRQRMKIVALKWTLLAIVSIRKGKRKWSELKCSTHIRSKWQNILKKLPWVTGQARKATTPLATWKCLITNEILDDIFQHTIQYILIQPNFSRASDSKFTDKI